MLHLGHEVLVRIHTQRHRGAIIIAESEDPHRECRGVGLEGDDGGESFVIRHRHIFGAKGHALGLIARVIEFQDAGLAVAGVEIENCPTGSGSATFGGLGPVGALGGIIRALVITPQNIVTTPFGDVMPFEDWLVGVGLRLLAIPTFAIGQDAGVADIEERDPGIHRRKRAVLGS